jgi:hypothetical protein
MTYALYGNIASFDYNTLVGTNPSTSSGALNSVWAIGGNNAGYGQPALAQVAYSSRINSSNWANLINTTGTVATHQGTSITSITAPALNGPIPYIAALPTNLTSIYNSRLNAATQGATTANTATYNSTWSNVLIFTHTISFANGDATRYFFNAGGQLKVTCSHANNIAGINLLMHNLASNIGTVVMSSPTSGSITVSGASYNGVTKVGGGLPAPTISPDKGYYAMTTANTNIFTQTASTGPAYYLNTNISIIAKSNGTQGSNQDAGNVITLYTVWDEISLGSVAVVGAGSSTTVTVQAPETTNLANSWGPINITGTVFGS